MAMKCINGACECTGCMACQNHDEDILHDENILRCNDCDCEINDGDDYYDFDDYVICIDCINNYWKVK